MAGDRRPATQAAATDGLPLTTGDDDRRSAPQLDCCSVLPSAPMLVPLHPHPPCPMPKQASHGRFAWHELAVTEPSAAESFYLQVTPWKTQPWDHAPDYTLLMNESTPLGGIACL